MPTDVRRTGLDCYLLHGLVVRSEVALGTMPVRDPGVGIDLDYLVGEARVVPALPPAGEVVARALHKDDVSRSFFTAARRSSGYIVRIHGLCDLEFDDAVSRAVCHLDPSGDPALVAVHLTGVVLAFAFGLRGQAVAHASAVTLPGTDDEVVALAGSSGVGKSTVAALLCALGCGFVTDDLLRFDVLDRHVVTVGGAPELRLRDGAVHVLDAFVAPGPPRRDTADGRVALHLASGDRTRRALRAIVVPAPDRVGTSVTLERLRPADALLLLARSPKLDGWLLPGVVRGQFDALARLAEVTPAFVARLPWLPGPDAETARQLLEALRRVLDEPAVLPGALS
jgi:hypothetical protein